MSKKNTRISGKRVSVSDSLFPLIFMILIFIFILYPVFCLIRSSFMDEGSFSLDKYRALLPGSLTLIKNSVFSGVLTALLSTLLSVCLALRISTAKGWLKRMFMMVLLITMVSPPFVTSLAYIQLFGRRGWITYSLLQLSVNPYNWRGVVIMQTISFASMNTLFLLGIMEKLNTDLLHASIDLGASPSKTVIKVLLPLIRPAVFACFLLTFIQSLADFGTPVIIGGRFETLASEIYMQIIGYSDLGKASALNMLIFLPSALMFILYRYLMKHSGRMLNRSTVTGSGTLDTFSIKGAAGLLIHLITGLFFITVTLQYTCIFASGFLKSIRGTYQVTTEHLERLITYDFSSIQRSITYALIVALAGSLFSMIFSYYIERRNFPFRNTLDFIATLPYMIPGSCFGIGYILAFNREPLKLTGTAAIVILNMIFRQISNTTKLCSASLSQIPVSLEDAARDLGASRLHVIFHLILPNLNRAFFTCFVYNFTTAMTTAGAILFLIHPRQKVAVFRLFDAVNTGEYGIASLIASCIILITLIVNLLLNWLTGTNRKGGLRYVFTAGKTS